METLAYLQAKRKERMRLLDEVREKAPGDAGILAQVLIMLSE